MSTIGLESWAVDLKDVGAVYPFQGTEVLMVIVAVVLWIGWHLWQLRAEGRGHRIRHEAHGQAKAHHG